MRGSPQQRPTDSKPEDKSANNKRGLPLLKLRLFLHRKWPTLVRHPEFQAELSIWRERDPQDNEKTSPPAEEAIDICCIWAIEFYTPAHIHSLLDGLKSLGWDKSLDGSTDRNPIDWIQRLRENSRAGGWFNLGHIYRPSNKRNFGLGVASPLPEGVEHGFAKIYNLTSSVTCVVIGFVLDSHFSGEYDGILRTRYATHLEPIGHGHAIHSPRFQKEDAIDRVRDCLRHLAGTWFKTHLPGLFSSGLLDGEFPTCELVKLRHGVPFPKQGDQPAGSREYLHALDLQLDLHSWELQDIPAIKFAWPLIRSREQRYHAIIAFNENQLSDNDLKSWGGRERSSFIAYIDNRVNKLLNRWALIAVLAGYERQLNALRDSIAAIRSRSSLHVLTALGDFVSKGVDVSGATAELMHYADHKGLFLSDLDAFTSSRRTLPGRQDATLGDALRTQIRERAEWLRNSDRSMRELLTQYASLLSARENIKVQRSLGRLTRILIILTVFIAALTIPTAYVAVWGTEGNTPMLQFIKNLFR